MGFFFQGLTLGLAYVAPIGMQNLFVIDSALTKPRRRALLTALIVLFFDVSLSLSCFFGIGRLMQDHAWLKLVILAIGGLVVIRIGAGLLFPGKGGDDGAAQTPQSRTSQSQGLAQRVTSKFGGDSELLHTIVTAGVVTMVQSAGHHRRHADARRVQRDAYRRSVHAVHHRRGNRVGTVVLRHHPAGVAVQPQVQPANRHRDEPRVWRGGGAVRRQTTS